MVSSLIMVRDFHTGRAVASWRARACSGVIESSVAIPDIKRRT